MSWCTVEGCSAEHYARGYCVKHYWRWRRHGDPLTEAERTPPPRRQRSTSRDPAETSRVVATRLPADVATLADFAALRAGAASTSAWLRDLVVAELTSAELLPMESP